MHEYSGTSSHWRTSYEDWLGFWMSFVSTVTGFCFLNEQLLKGHKLEGCVVSSSPPLVRSITSFLLGLWIHLISFSYAKKYGSRCLPHRISSQSNTFNIIKAKATYHFDGCNIFNYCQFVKIFQIELKLDIEVARVIIALKIRKIVHCVKNGIGPHYNDGIYLRGGLDIYFLCW